MDNLISITDVQKSKIMIDNSNRPVWFTEKQDKL